MNVVAIDSGVRTAGIASDGVARVVRNPWTETTRGKYSIEAAKEMSGAIVTDIDTFFGKPTLLLIELSPSRGMAERSQDLSNVAVVVGAVARAYQKIPVLAVTPSQWNGGKRKGHWVEWVRDVCGYRLEGAPPTSLENNAWDAAGMLEWYLLGGLTLGRSLSRMVA